MAGALIMAHATLPRTSPCVDVNRPRHPKVGAQHHLDCALPGGTTNALSHRRRHDAPNAQAHANGRRHGSRRPSAVRARQTLAALRMNEQGSGSSRLSTVCESGLRRLAPWPRERPISNPLTRRRPASSSVLNQCWNNLGRGDAVWASVSSIAATSDMLDLKNQAPARSVQLPRDGPTYKRPFTPIDPPKRCALALTPGLMGKGNLRQCPGFDGKCGWV